MRGLIWLKRTNCKVAIARASLLWRFTRLALTWPAEGQSRCVFFIPAYSMHFSFPLEDCDLNTEYSICKDLNVGIEEPRIDHVSDLIQRPWLFYKYGRASQMHSLKKPFEKNITILHTSLPSTVYGDILSLGREVLRPKIGKFSITQLRSTESCRISYPVFRVSLLIQNFQG